jgi:hypothetical protein
VDANAHAQQVEHAAGEIAFAGEADLGHRQAAAGGKEGGRHAGVDDHHITANR